MLLKTKRVYNWCPDKRDFLAITERKRVRCPTCNRRLLPMEVYEYSMFGREDLVGFKLPPHKTYKLKGGTDNGKRSRGRARA